MPKWEVIDLYRVRGLAPTYTNPKRGGTYENVVMNWWVWRQDFFHVAYDVMFGTKEYNWVQVLALTQMFLLPEAEMFKKWIDNLYPEENTTIIKAEQPFPNDIVPIQVGWTGKKGSCRCKPYNYHFDLDVWYYIDLTDCKLLKPAQEGDSIVYEYTFP
jgi:hypothetical protein